MQKHISDLFLDHHQTWNHLTINFGIIFHRCGPRWDIRGGTYGFLIWYWLADNPILTRWHHDDIIGQVILHHESKLWHLSQCFTAIAILHDGLSRTSNSAPFSPPLTQVTLQFIKINLLNLKVWRQHRCWRRNVLATILRCLWRYWPFLSPAFSIFYCKISVG